MFPDNKPYRRPGVITEEIARKLPWNKTNREIAVQYNLPVRAIWTWRERLGKLKVPANRGPKPNDRRHWNWKLSNAELSRQHGVSRQRVHDLRRRFAGGIKSPIAAGTAIQIYNARLSKRPGAGV